MGGRHGRAKLVLDAGTRSRLESIARSRKEGQARVERAQVLIALADGGGVAALARAFRTNRPKIQRILDRALELGALASLEDRPGRGRKAEITGEARDWLIAKALEKPADSGCPGDSWTTRALALHARKAGPDAGHPCLARLGGGTVSKVLGAAGIGPRQIGRPAPEGNPPRGEPLAQVLLVSHRIHILRETGMPGKGEADTAGPVRAWLALDEMAGSGVAGESGGKGLPARTRSRSLGAVRLLAGLDLRTGRVFAHVEDRHRSPVAARLLESIHLAYPPETRILVILDRLAALAAVGTRDRLKVRPGRFEFVSAPRLGSWLNLVEVFFEKMTRLLLRSLQARTKADLLEGIVQGLEDLDRASFAFRWPVGPDEGGVA